MEILTELANTPEDNFDKVDCEKLIKTLALIQDYC